jgi:hypothetical protein
MAIVNERRYFIDTLVEMVGIKSGLAVTVPEAQQLLERDPPDKGWWKGKRKDLLRLEPVEVEIVFLRLLRLLGAIPDEMHPKILLFEYAKANPVEVPKGFWAPGKLPEKLRAMPGANYLQRVLLEHLEYKKPIPAAILGMPGFPDLMKQYAMREIMDDNLSDSRTWDGIVRLSDLFKSEDAPSRPDTYFDQRFIDYLHAQNVDLAKMNWRQFEYLTGEYFHRTGYKVTIGPGRKDGGIDVRAAKERVFAGPEVILIQCKRHKEPNEVTINEVKSLWADVLDEGAVGGVMATTTRLAKGARDYCDARR